MTKTIDVYYNNGLLWWLDLRTPSSNLKYPATRSIAAGVAESFRREGLKFVIHTGETMEIEPPVIYSQNQEAINGKYTV